MLLYKMLAYLMLIAALSNPVCLYNVFFSLLLPLIYANAFFFLLCLGLLTHNLFMSCIILHHAVLLICLFFSNSMFTPFFIFL